MAYSVEFSRRAERDLGRIFAAINAEQSQPAARWFDGLQTHIEKLATLPDRGTITRYDSKLRFLHYGNKPHVYRILYRVDRRSNRVLIVHIRHGARAPIG
jgi:plasmid stabilization system protein ParE